MSFHHDDETERVAICLHEAYALIVFYMASFVILISGTALPSPTPTCNTHVADVVLVLESSGSIREMNPANGSYNNWNRILFFVYKITRQLNVASNSVHVGLVIYSQYANNEFFLDYSYYNATLGPAGACSQHGLHGVIHEHIQ